MIDAGDTPEAGVDLDFVPRPRPDLIVIEMNDGAVLYESGGGTMYRLPVLATQLWACFDGTSSLERIAAELADGATWSAESLTPQLLAFAASMASAGLIVDGARH